MMSLSFPIYSASLAIYFLLTIKYEMEHTLLTQRVEPFMHFFAILHPLTLAIYAVSIGFFAPNFVDATFCWYGYGCSESDEVCMAEQDALPFTRVVNIFGTTVLVGAIVTIVVSMTSVYLYIRAKEHVLQQHLNVVHHVVPGDEHVAKRSRQTATQALLYSGAFLLTVGPALVREMIRVYGYSAIPENRSFFFWSGILGNVSIFSDSMVCVHG
jgi:hypothetical protein